MSSVMCHGWKWFLDTLPVVSIKQHGGRRRIPSSQLDDDQSHTDGNQDDKSNPNAHQDQHIEVYMKNIIMLYKECFNRLSYINNES